MSKIVSLFSPSSIGFTFLSWTLHYLAGHDTSYNCEDCAYHNLPDNPLTKHNAHAFAKNHPSGVTQTQKYIADLQKLDSDKFQTIYATVIPGEFLLDGTPEELASRYKEVLALEKADSVNENKLCSNAGPFIVSDIDPRNKTYQFAIRTLENRLFDRGTYADEDDYRAHMNKLFFSKSIRTYSELELTDVWDIREQTALNLRLHPNKAIKDYADLSLPHYYINSNDLWFNLDNLVYDIFNYIGESVDNSRYTSWLSVYKAWRDKQTQINKFDWYVDQIVECIVNNWHFDLRQLDITFDQEAVIQHILIYKHNLTIKGWGLTKFPDNTQQLHQLLEPNFHALTEY